MRFRVARRARQELVDILDYTARHNRGAADRLKRQFDVAFGNLKLFPRMGKQIDELPGRPRVVVVEPYLILYEIAADELTVIRVVHGRRDVKALLDEQ